MIPVHLLTSSAAPAPPAPENGICYLVGKSGIYKQIVNAFYSARLKVAGISHLEDTSESVKLRVPKLPLKLLQQAEAFFLTVYEAHHSEAVVVLLANPATNEWRIDAPIQEVDGSLHVSYDPTSISVPKGFTIFGTIHSHANIPAFHSATDDSDECCSDGLHITIGNLDKPARSYSARWMICGSAYPAKLEDVLTMPLLPAADPAWLERVQAGQPSVFENTSGNSFPESTFRRDSGRAETDPDIPPDVPPGLEDDYFDFMNEAHERFLARASAR